jgi:VCBS repeat protein/FG-GAP repeat protein
MFYKTTDRACQYSMAKGRPWGGAFFKIISVFAVVPFVFLGMGRAIEPAISGDANFEIKKLEIGAGDNAVLLRDFNGDGLLDLAVAVESDGRVSIMLGDGKGGLSAPRFFSAGENLASLDSGDFNADGHLDLVVVNHDSPYLALLLGDGAGGFTAAKNSPLRLVVAPHPHMVRAEDMNQDGIIDLIVDSRDEFGIFILKGLGQGTFDVPGIGINVEGAPYLGFAMGDVNGDERLDLITPNARDISVMLNVRSSSLTFDHSQSIGFASPFAVELADMNGDGNLDVIVASAEGGGSGIGIFPGDGSGQFGNDMNQMFPAASGAKNIATGDVNGDGLSDTVISNWNAEIHLIFGGVSGFTSVTLPLGALQAPWGVAIGDLNGDGLDDLIVADGEGSAANIYLGQSGPE